MQWIECRVHTTHAAHELIAQLFITHGANGTVLEDSRGKDFTPEPWTDIIGKPKTEHLPTDGVVVKAYFPDDGTLEATLSAVKKDLVQLEATTNQPVAQTEILLTTVHEEDWAEAWKAYYKPVQVSETMSIVRTWESYEKRREDEHVITMDPGMAFGTGTHETTLLCLQALEHIVNDGDTVIDVGTGSGILSIAAAKLGAKAVHAVDLDPLAVQVAKENSEANNVSERITIEQRDLLSESSNEQKADIVVANLLAHLVIALAPDIHRHLKVGGKLVVSGIIKQKEQEVIDVLKQENFQIDDVLEQKDWVAIRCRLTEVGGE
ncbi:LOW QUALITY PROTEIN: ribosomal protein L11 methyltransferase [Geomicrobium sp. JCM 19055]|nr:LOW QUALITY PROTEIN: ribosomal protein L11 methyltransferase [Geomicrobium sp. JCM 19055]